MPYYITCPSCGANLDPGEQCDCQKSRKESDRMPKICICPYCSAIIPPEAIWCSCGKQKEATPSQRKSASEPDQIKIKRPTSCHWKDAKGTGAEAPLKHTYHSTGGKVPSNIRVQGGTRGE